MAKLISKDHKYADIMASADYTVIDKHLIPEYADWNVCFATNQLVLCFTENSQHADTINQDNWYSILARKDVAWGHSDPNLDPCGYRSLMVLQLAEKYYEGMGLYASLTTGHPKRHVLPKAKELVRLLKEDKLDYAWEYLSVAVQHGLKYVTLPDQVNLGSSQYDDFYGQASVKVTGKNSSAFTEKKGISCTYGVTLLKNSKNQTAAQAFLSYLLDPVGGLKVLSQMGQPPIVTSRLTRREMISDFPVSLVKLVEPQLS